MFQAFHMLRKYSFLEYKFARGRSISPDFVTFILTKVCNYHCDWCSAHSPGTKKGNNDLTTEEWFRIVDELKPLMPAIYLCGGEPTLRKDYLEIIRYVKKQGMLCAMTTNGSNLNETSAKEMVESGLDFLSISLDGDEDFHDSHRGKKGAYQSVVDGIKLVQKFKGDNPAPHIKIVGVFDPDNPFNGKHVLGLGNELDVDEINFGHLMYYTPEVLKDQQAFQEKYGIGSDYITGGEMNVPEGSIEDLKSMVDMINKNEKVRTSITQGAIDIDKYYGTDDYPAKSSKCLTPWFSASIKPDGGVSPCMEYDVGNIRESRFMDIWNDKKWVLFRQLKAKGESVPACFRCGEGQIIKFD